MLFYFMISSFYVLFEVILWHGDSGCSIKLVRRHDSQALHCSSKDEHIDNYGGHSYNVGHTINDFIL